MLGTRNQTLRRRGVTLLEVIVAMAIFVVSLGAVGHLVYMGSQRSLEAQLQAQGLQKCQSKMSEMISGSLPLTSTNGNYPDDSTWQFDVECTQQDSSTLLYTVKVTASHQVDSGPRFEVSLSQMVLDPSQTRMIGGNPNNTNNGNNNGTNPMTGGSGTTGSGN